MICFSKTQGQRQANVATADDSDFQLRAFKKLGFPKQYCVHKITYAAMLFLIGTTERSVSTMRSAA